MGTVKALAEAVERGLTAALPQLRKTVVRKLSLAVGLLKLKSGRPGHSLYKSRSLTPIAYDIGRN
jgi:hypothetical protein